MRDDYMQMAYLRAVFGYYADEQNNPVSVEYDGPMVDMTRAHVWAWDARPYPYFPGNTTLWSDGGNYARGHWLNGRASSRTLAGVVADICLRSGVEAFDVSGLHGVVRGYLVDDITTGRAALQPLMTAYGFDATEKNGKLVFANRDGQPLHVVTDNTLALDPESDVPLSLVRAPEAEISGRVQFNYIDADGDFETSMSEAIHPDEQAYGVARNEAPLALTRGEGARTVSRWLQEARLATETVSFALPPSQNEVCVGDVIDVDARGHQGLYRIDRMDQAGLRKVEATRVDPEVYIPQELYEEGASLTPFVGPTPVELLFLDLPLLTGDEVPHEPHVAASARPWPGAVAVYGSASDSDYALQTVLRRRSVIGRLQTPLKKGPLGVWDRQSGVQVKLLSGALASAEDLSVFAGSNTLAIGDGSTDLWEIIQFAQAEPVGNRRFEISQLLRGQSGTSEMMQDSWPAGSVVVMLDGRPEQITLPSSGRGAERHFRYGPAKQSLTDPSYKYALREFKGNGYRPYPVVHLQGAQTATGIDVFWTRATRIDGDIWDGMDVPLGETSEQYRVQVLQNGVIRRQLVATSPQWSYPATLQHLDLDAGPFVINVAQISERYGAGPSVSLNLLAGV